ncbi:MAG: ABC transporter ATP-binding protein [Burkholderiales bacterium]|nr:ABC transporter ATP-binding protein [Burkholderiales bacterium]
MSAPAAIETRALSKRYGGFVAVDGLDLRIDEGTVFGLLGPNGSGKTTTILMLMGLTEVTSGSVRVLGLDPVRQPLEVKRAVGYMPDAVGFYDDLTARENLRYSGKLAGLRGEPLERRIDAALSRARLVREADRPVRTFSRGMRQRLGLADVLLKAPRIAILDEPTSGLDPQSTHEFLDMIRDLKAEGLTVLLSSHLLDRVQAVCDRVGLFHRGRMVLEGSVDELARRVLGGGYRITVEARGADGDDRGGLAAALHAIAGVNRVERSPEGALRLHADRDVRPEVATAVARAGAALLGLGMAAPSLDDVYTEYFREVRHAA